MTEMTNLRVPAARYLRMSTDSQRYSLENQAALIDRYAAGQNFEIVRTYEDAARSGVTATHRAGLKSLLNDVLTGQAAYSTILVVDVSRWGRFQDPDEAAHYEFICREAGVSVEYCAEVFDNDGSMVSGLVKNLKRMMAAEYSRQLSDRCKAGLERTVRSGGRPGGSATYGFARAALDPASGTLRPLPSGEMKSRLGDQVVTVLGPPDQVAMVRRIFAMFVTEVRSPPEIATILNRAGVPCSRPGKWNSQRIKRVLQNELVTGIQLYHRSRCNFGAREMLAPELWTRTRVTKAIVSMAMFRAAQKRIESRVGVIHTNEELIAGLKRVLAEHGGLTMKLVRAHAYASFSVYQQRFRSIATMHRLAGYRPSGRSGHHVWRGEFSRETAIEGLRQLLAEEGYLSQALINETPRLPHASTLRSRYGSLEVLYREIGFDMPPRSRAKARWAKLPR